MTRLYFVVLFAYHKWPHICLCVQRRGTGERMMLTLSCTLFILYHTLERVPLPLDILASLSLGLDRVQWNIFYFLILVSVAGVRSEMRICVIWTFIHLIIITLCYIGIYLALQKYLLSSSLICRLALIHIL